MWKPNLNRHFAKILPALKISFFLVVWNGLFHSLTLSILIYGSLTSTRISEMSRMSTLNQFWTENQILFATLSSVAGVLFFRDQFRILLKDSQAGLRILGANFLRGVLFSALLIFGLILSHRYEFLGFSAQLSLNFLTSYAWIFRAFLLLIFVTSNEWMTRVLLREELTGIPSKITTTIIETGSYLIVFWIWFNPSLRETVTLILLFLLFKGFWSATGFVSALFIVSHAVFGLPFFENEFVGVLQLKPLLEDARSEETILQNPYLIFTLLILVIAVRGSRHLVLKSKPQSLSRKDDRLHES